MPSIPPPAPPTELFEDSAHTSSGASSRGPKDNTKGPHCIALYDYDSPHADDLSFKVGNYNNLGVTVPLHYILIECLVISGR